MDPFVALMYIVFAGILLFAVVVVAGEYRRRNKAGAKSTESAAAANASKANSVDMTAPVVLQQASVGTTAPAPAEAPSQSTPKLNDTKKTAAKVSSKGNMWFDVEGVKRRAAGEPCAVRSSDPARLAECAKRKSALLTQAREQQAEIKKARKNEKRKARRVLRMSVPASPIIPSIEDQLHQQLIDGGVMDGGITD